jgi:cell division cycle 20-like protein 1 (cofactor of APC complex)
MNARPTKRGGDVFGDITAPVRNGSAGVSASGGMKGKGVVRDYGDRFIPTRDGTDLHAVYQLMNEVDPITGREIVGKPKGRRKSGQSGGTDQDVRRGEW